MPVQLEEQWHVVAGYMCTPLVTFKMDDLNGNKKLIGKTVAEIGAGNTPTGIISYSYKGKDYILVGNNVPPVPLSLELVLAPRVAHCTFSEP